jgi:hypothetical protein
MTTAEHNAPHFLAVRWQDWVHGKGRIKGWYVVRTCPCHWGQAVSLPYPDRERAERVRRVLVGELTTRSAPKLRWPLLEEADPL